MFPGLAGDSRSGYVISLAKYLAEECGYTVGVFHNRGVGQELTSAMLPDLVSSEEINQAFSHMLKRHSDPNKRTYFVGIGMSMGANVLLRAAGEQGSKLPLEALVSLNNPFDVWLAINLMRGTPYERHLAYALKKQIVLKPSLSDQGKIIYDELAAKHDLSMQDLKDVSSWRDWDEHYTKKVYPQYASVADYYYAASALSKIQNISVPTLVVHSRDDPIVPFECMPVRECLSNPNIIVSAVEKGGHVCYFQGAGGQKRWYPRASAEFLDAVIEIKERKYRGEVETTME